MKRCKWCGRMYDENKQSEAFCSDNPNRDRNVAMYFSGGKRWKKIHAANRESLRNLVASVEIARIVVK